MQDSFCEFADEQVLLEGQWPAFLEFWSLQLRNDTKMSPQLKSFFIVASIVYDCIYAGDLKKNRRKIEKQTFKASYNHIGINGRLLYSETITISNLMDEKQEKTISSASTPSFWVPSSHHCLQLERKIGKLWRHDRKTPISQNFWDDLESNSCSSDVYFSSLRHDTRIIIKRRKKNSDGFRWIGRKDRWPIIMKRSIRKTSDRFLKRLLRVFRWVLIVWYLKITDIRVCYLRLILLTATREHVT